MAIKKTEYTIEELEEQYNQLLDQQNSLKEQIEQKKQAEEAKKIAKLAEEKEARYEEVATALEHAFKLVNEYVADYGSFTMNTGSETWMSVLGNTGMRYYF